MTGPAEEQRSRGATVNGRNDAVAGSKIDVVAIRADGRADVVRACAAAEPLARGLRGKNGGTFPRALWEFAEAYDGVTVRFTVRAGTADQLARVGVRDAAEMTATLFPNLPLVMSGWNRFSAFFKSEGGIINIGLGQGAALDLFNRNIVRFEIVRP